MGAGTRYTTKSTGELACWIDLNLEDTEEDMRQFAYDDIIEDLNNLIVSLGYYKDDNKRGNFFRNGLFELELEPTYYGDGLVIQLNPKPDIYDHRQNIAMSNLERGEKKILRALIKAGYELRIATSGYTSRKVTEV